jgi:hypothetical protein
MSATKSLLPDIDLAKIRRFAEARVPARARHQVRLELEVSGRAVTVVECRAPWTPEVGPQWSRFPIARLRFSATTATWMLYWRDRNLVWHRYQRVDATPFVDPLLAEIEADPTHIFWD